MNTHFIPITRPTLPKLSSLQEKMDDMFKSGMITDHKYVQLFETECTHFLKTKHAIALSNGTTALLLALKCLDISGEVILPSFTYSSGAHVLLWAGIKPIFADINPETFNLDPIDVERKITKKTTAIMPTHVFGNPCDIAKFQKLSKKHDLKLIYDGAHAFGSSYKNKPVSTFGNATIFSFTPTKVLTTCEGGLIATNDDNLAKKLRIAKLNGDSLNRDEEFLGYTGRMSELHAIIGLECLKIFKKSPLKRLDLVNTYVRLLSQINGISFQKITDNSSSVYKDFTIIINPEKTGFTREQALRSFKKNSIQAKIYFHPPLHRKMVYKEYRNNHLPHTEFVADHIMSLPLYSHMPLKEVKKVCKVLLDLHTKSKKK